MASVFRFRLAHVMELAEHAVTAAHHVELVDDEPASPALLLVADDGVYLMSNGLPQPQPGPDQPADSTVRAVFAEHIGHDEPGHHGDDLLIPVPLCTPGEQLIERLRSAVRDGYDALVITILDQEVIVSAAHPSAQR